jgi:high-affinity iron transporter
VLIHPTSEGVGSLSLRRKKNIQKNFGLGITLFALVSVYREGFEIALFLKAAYFTASTDAYTGLLIGSICAIILGYFVIKSVIRINLRRFFLITGALLILISAGLVSRAIGEFQEAGALNILGEKAWNIHSIFDSDANLGKILESIFGYDDNPSILQTIGYAIYLIGAAYFLLPRKSKLKSNR